jgi:integrase
MRRFSDQLKEKSAATKTWRADPPSPHDLRRTFATRLSSLGISKEDRDALLNHIRADVGSKHYDLYERAKEKRAALAKWHDALTAVLNGTGAEEAGFKKARKR